MAIVIRSPEADADFGDIFDHIARSHPPAANALIRHIVARAQLHADSPFMGTPCFDVAENLRSFIVVNYAGFYLPVADGIWIVRVLHTARDLPRAFFDTLTGP